MRGWHTKILAEHKPIQRKMSAKKPTRITSLATTNKKPKATKGTKSQLNNEKFIKTIKHNRTKASMTSIHQTVET